MAGYFDAELYGALLYSLRRLRKFQTAAALADAVTEAGVRTRERTIWAIERGDQVAGVDRDLAFRKILRPAEGYFEEALRDGPPEQADARE